VCWLKWGDCYVVEADDFKDRAAAFAEILRSEQRLAVERKKLRVGRLAVKTGRLRIVDLRGHNALSR